MCARTHTQTSTGGIFTSLSICLIISVPFFTLSLPYLYILPFLWRKWSKNKTSLRKLLSQVLRVGLVSVTFWYKVCCVGSSYRLVILESGSILPLSNSLRSAISPSCVITVITSSTSTNMENSRCFCRVPTRIASLIRPNVTCSRAVTSAHGIRNFTAHERN